MAIDEEKSPNKISGILLNLTLIALAVILIYFLVKKNTTNKPVEIFHFATLNEYGQPAFIGTDLKKLRAYDIKIPFASRQYLMVEVGGHMTLTLKQAVQVTLKDKVLIQFREDGLDLLEGSAAFSHPSGLFPKEFHVYRKGVPVALSESPMVLQ